jgi:tRNA (adenine57-N1/adenine58-N1)-methyltransferase
MDFVRSSSSDKIMRAGDLVILSTSHDSADHLWLTPGALLDNKFGHFRHDEFIGKPFGTKVKARIGAGWILALQPTPELWSVALNTRTQIVNCVDASVIVLNLDLFPGCIAVESGTGSGSMTLHMARCVAPTGHIHTFEYNEQRAIAAVRSF